MEMAGRPAGIAVSGMVAGRLAQVGGDPTSKPPCPKSTSTAPYFRGLKRTCAPPR